MKFLSFRVVKERGFTLIEMLTVIAIIGILSSVVLASLMTARTQSRDKVRVSDVEQARLAFRLYAEKNAGTYPTSAVGGSEIGVNVALNTAMSFYGTLPKDPKSSNNPSSIGTNAYVYDSNYNCTAAGQKVVYVKAFEKLTNLANESTLCGSAQNTKYIIIIE